MFVTELSKLNDTLGLLQKEYNILVPAIYENGSDFIPLNNTTQSSNETQNGNKTQIESKDLYEITLNHNVLLSPKQHFFPQTEGLYRFKTTKNSVDIQSLPEKKEKHLLFGVRSCDMKSLECLDQVFLTKGFVDNLYKTKRDNTVIVALACNSPGPTCFCTSMGVDPQQAIGTDIQAYITDKFIEFEPLTPAGQHVINMITPSSHLPLESAGHSVSLEQTAVSAQDQQVPDEFSVPVFANGEFTRKVDFYGVPEKLQSMFDSKIWDEIARKCLNCGACTYICPTCHCFDISQDVRGEEGVKYRCWDSCMFKEYTQMAGGHNPRSGKMEKVRNRFMHKLRYFMERYDMMLCTGCGRCIEVCPVGMDITAVIRKIKEAEVNV